MNNKIYSMELLAEKHLENKKAVVFSYNRESRSRAIIDFITEYENSIESVLILIYGDITIDSDVEKKLSNYNNYLIKVTCEPYDFVNGMKSIPPNFWCDNMLLDISCIKIPEMFTLMKFLKESPNINSVDVVYSMPYDYIFNAEPFTSYKSYLGDLTMYELLGYSGTTEKSQEKNLYLFMGFEGALGLKVIEDSTYTKLVLVNNLPSFFPKYKDISVVNNYELMKNHHNYIYTPADNPFETYNLLDKIVDPTSSTCIAPLSTKPVALGICLFALSHSEIRIVYPISSEYSQESTIKTYKSTVYHVDLMNENIPTE